MMQLLHMFLRNQWHVTFASSAADSEFAEDITSLGIDKVSIELNNSSFDQFVKDVQPQVVVFDRFMSEEQYGWRVAEAAPKRRGAKQTRAFFITAKASSALPIT